MLRTRTPFIHRTVDALDQLVGRVRRMAAGAEPSVLSRRPGEGRWSAVECIDYLNATARLYLEPFEEAIADARRDGMIGDRADGRTLLGRVIAWAMEPPPRLKTRTQSELEPAPALDPEAVVEDFATLHGALSAQLQGAAYLDRKRVKVRSLLDSRLKLSLDDWYAFIASHARRHLWQADRALAEITAEASPN